MTEWFKDTAFLQWDYSKKSDEYYVWFREPFAVTVETSFADSVEWRVYAENVEEKEVVSEAEADDKQSAFRQCKQIIKQLNDEQF